MSAGKLAKPLGVPRTRIERLASAHTGVTPDTALRLSRYFAMTPQFWLNLQAKNDLALAATNPELDEIRPLAAAE